MVEYKDSSQVQIELDMFKVTGIKGTMYSAPKNVYVL